MGEKYIDILISKGLNLHECGHLREARNFFEELAGFAQDTPRVHYHLGMLCMEMHDNSVSLQHFRELVRLQPDFLEGRMLLGMTCAELGLQEEAVEWLLGVVAEYPNVAEIHHRIGLSLADLHRYEEAYREYQEVLRIDPDHTGVLCSLGVLFTTTGQIREARDFLLRAFERDPASVNVINNLGRVCKIGHAGESLAWFQRGLDLQPDNPSLTSNYLYTLNYVPDLSPEFVAGRYRELAPRCFYPRTDWRAPQEPAQGSRPLRIGYLSADLYGHSVAFFLEPVMMNHDLGRFELFCYSNRTAADETTERLKQHCSGWRCIYGLSDEMVAAMIAEDRIDVLVELSGHTSGHRLGVCAYRPAPLQVSWLGHPNTTGLPQMDYYLTDAWCDPPGKTDHLFSEQLYRLPRVFSCYLPPTQFPAVASAPILASGRITLGSFNNISKVNDPLISLWARILREISNSVIYLKSPGLDDRGTREDLVECFLKQGISRERVIISGVAGSREEHLARYSAVDIALDTFPYHGTTTTCEALWMGVPVITLAGDTHASRVGVSFLHAVGLDDLIAGTPDDYVAIAVKLARDQQRLVRLRENLRTMMARSPLMDAVGVTREVENAFQDMMINRRHVG